MFKDIDAGRRLGQAEPDVDLLMQNRVWRGWWSREIAHPIDDRVSHDVHAAGTGTTNHRVEVAGATTIAIESSAAIGAGQRPSPVGKAKVAVKHLAASQELQEFKEVQFTERPTIFTNVGNRSVRLHETRAELVSTAQGQQKLDEIVSLWNRECNKGIAWALCLAAVGNDGRFDGRAAAVMQIGSDGGDAP